MADATQESLNETEKENAPNEEALAGERVRETVRAIKNDDEAALRNILSDSHASDTAEILSLLNKGQRDKLIDMVGDSLDSAVLAELDDNLQAKVAEQLDPEQLVAAVQELETDDAVFVLGEMDATGQQEILEKIPVQDRIVLQRSLDYPNESAGRLMRSDVVAAPPYWTIGQTLDFLRDTEDLPDDFWEILVVDPTHTPVGVVQLNKAMRSSRPTLLGDIMDERLNTIPAEMDREDMARQFERYNLFSAPVVDHDGRLVGVVTADDVFEVIAEEAEEDILRLGGVGDETVSDSMLMAARSRFSWLFVNLLTAILASMVIAMFDASIEQMVALAVLMPIVASMGGNAATQTLTISVRALATRELIPVNAFRVVSREIGIGLVNGILFALLLGAVGAFWFDNAILGVVLAMAMLVNMFVAGMSGILIPIGLDKLGIDPAVASGVFVTTITDVIGFLAFLGFATVFLL